MTRMEMNFSDYLRVIRKRISTIIIFLILIVGATSFYTIRQTPLFSATSKVQIEQKKSVAEILTEMITWSPENVIISQANFIKSFQILEKVAEELDIIHPEMNKDEHLARIKGLQSQITAEQVSRTNIIAITAFSSNPEEAAKKANTVARVYADTHFENKKRDITKAKQFIKAQLDLYEKELAESEDALKKFREENPLITEMNGSSSAFIPSDPQVIRLKEEIVKIESELRSLKSFYTEEYPEVVSQLKKLEEAKIHLSRTMYRLTSQQRELSVKELRLLRLKRNASIAEDLYTMFKKKYEEARILEAEKAQDVSVIELALKPTKSIKPNTRSNIFIGILCGLLIGLVMAFVRESLDTSIGRIEDIENLLKIPVLGVIPSPSWDKRKKIFRHKRPRKDNGLPPDSRFKRLVVVFDPFSVTAEAYRNLQVNLDLIGLKAVGNRIVITSAAPREGKTQTLCNLAMIMAQLGKKVLIIGSDFRKPMISEIFGIKRSPGLTDILLGNVTWEEAANTVTDLLLGDLGYESILKMRGIENLHIIPSGKRSPDPFGLLNFSNLNKLTEELKQNFDIILFDSPPVLPVADSAILANCADGVILVYKAGHTSRHALVRAKVQLENVNAKILGVVINNVKPQLAEDITPYQKYRYTRYHEEESEDV